MLRSGTIIMIREKAAAGKSAYAIGKDLGISKNTALKYMESRDDAPAKNNRPSKLDEYKPLLNKLMGDGIFNCVVLLERLQTTGYDGGISIIKDYVHQYRPPKNIPAVQRFETLSGKQAQMDWGICQYNDSSGTIHKVAAFVMILGSSRAKYVEFTNRCDLSSMERCMVNAFAYFGGVPETVLTDNMKTVVVGRESGKPIWNTGFAEFAVDMGFVPKVCKVRSPQTKGKVERLVRYVKDNFFAGRSFEELNDLNLQALAWCRLVDGKVHGTTGKIPLLELRNEKLLSLPAQNVLDKYRWESRVVTREGLVSFDGIRYGVPWQYSGKEVRVRLCNGNIEVYCGEAQIAKHEAKYKGGRIVWLKGQYAGLGERKGIAVASSYAHMAPAAVEIRELSVYDQLLEVASNG